MFATSSLIKSVQWKHTDSQENKKNKNPGAAVSKKAHIDSLLKHERKHQYFISLK